ncbi:MAG: amidohydrolase family protein [Microbacteriaceae bacterium]
MMTDWHSHVWEPSHLGHEWGPQLDAHYQHQPSATGSADRHWETMHAAGIDECIVIGLVSDYLSLDIPNEYVAEYVARWNGNAIGVACVDPTRASAVADLEYAASELGLRGVKLAPPYQNFHPHSDEAFVVYRRAAELGMFMIFHQGGVTHRRGVMEVAQPYLLDKVARSFPDTTIIIAHMGQPWHNEVVSLLRKHPRVFADVSARCTRPAQLRRILMDVSDYNCLDKLVWGSDFPTFDPTTHAAQFLEAAGDGSDNLPQVSQLQSILARRLADIPGIRP